jgi:hypothetical protein
MLATTMRKTKKTLRNSRLGRLIVANISRQPLMRLDVQAVVPAAVQAQAQNLSIWIATKLTQGLDGRKCAGLSAGDTTMVESDGGQRGPLQHEEEKDIFFHS